MKITFIALIILIFTYNVFPANINQTQEQQNTNSANNITQENNASNQNRTSPSIQNDSVIDLGNIVIGAVPYDVSLSRLPYNVEVITRRQIENSNSVSIVDAMNYATGIITQRLGGYESLYSARLRGSNTNQTAVLINGFKIATSFDGGAYTGEFSSSFFESVEILKGNGSVLYGTNANYGVVNYTTRNIKLGHHTLFGTAFGQGGIRGLKSFYGLTTYGTANLKLMVGGSYLTQDAIRMAEIDPINASVQKDKTKANSHADNTNFIVNLGINNESKSFYLNFTTMITNKTCGIPGYDQEPNVDDFFRQKNYIFAVTPVLVLSKAITLKLTAYLNHSRYKDDNYDADPGFGAPDNILRDDFKYFKYGYELILLVKPVDKLVLTVGLNHDLQRFEKQSNHDPLDIGPVNVNQLAGYLHVDYSISIVQLMAGVRIDYHKSLEEDIRQSFGTMVSMQAGVLVSVLKDYLKIKGQISHSHNIPSILDTSWPGYENLNLKNVKFWTFEASVESRVNKIFYAKATLYFYRYNDTKVLVYSDYKSIGKERSYGFECEVSVMPLAKLKLPFNIRIFCNLWLQKTENYLTAQVVAQYKPKVIINSGLEFILKMGLTIGVYTQYRQNYQNPDTNLPYADYYMKYFLMDIKVNYRLKTSKMNFRIFLSMINVLNTNYAISGNHTVYGHYTFTMPGRTILGGCEIQF